MSTRTFALVAVLAALTTVPTASAQAQGASVCRPPHVEAMRQLMEEYVDAFNSHDPAQFETVLAPEYYTENPLGVFHGLETMQGLMLGVYAALPDIEYAIETVVVYGDTVVLEYTYTATHLGEFLGIPPTGNVVYGRGMELHRVQDGRLVATWNYSDIFGLLAQLGAF